MRRATAFPTRHAGCSSLASYAADGGTPTRYVPMRNAAESPYRYMIDPEEQLNVWLELEDNDEVPWGIVHSHVASPAVPSATDVGLAFFPDSLYLVCSLADPERPTVRAWSIVDTVTESHWPLPRGSPNPRLFWTDSYRRHRDV